MIYLDNAATSFPKPQSVAEAISGYLNTAGNPGRSGHRMARAGEDCIWDARLQLAKLFSFTEPERVIFTSGATMALNIAIKGLAQPGERILTSRFEHNSVVRPLTAGHSRGLRWTAVPPSTDSPIDLDLLDKELADSDTRLVVISHASNVTGAVVPLTAVRSIAHQHGARLVVDTAQTAGHRGLAASDADVLVFAGHKGLLGPQGTGGLLVCADDLRIAPLIEGGTGGRSELRHQPRWLPYALEAGTPNGIGIAGLGAAVSHVQSLGIDTIAHRERAVRAALVAGLAQIEGVTVHDVASSEAPVCVVSATLAGRTAAEVVALLDERHAILARGGVHCAPLAHETLGTLPAGTVRFSPSHQTTDEEIEMSVQAVREIQASKP